MDSTYSTIVVDPPWPQDVSRDINKVISRSQKHTDNPAKYSTIVVDPPWPQDVITKPFLQDAAEKSRSPRVTNKVRRQPYHTMQYAEIWQLPIPDMASNPCHILLWCTQSTIQEAFHILSHWGATYRCCTTWNKHRGVHTWRITRSTEFILYGTIGEGHPLPLANWPTMFDIPAGKSQHSEKPAKIYRKIVECFPGPRLDMFARRVHFGFQPQGDQIVYESHEQEVLPV